MAVGVPDMVNSLPATTKLTPDGSPATVALVAPPPNSYIILSIASPSQITCVSVPAREIKSKSASGFTVMVPLELVLAQAPVVVTV